jgi:hypothetical protein
MSKENKMTPSRKWYNMSFVHSNGTFILDLCLFKFFGLLLMAPSRELPLPPTLLLALMLKLGVRETPDLPEVFPSAGVRPEVIPVGCFLGWVALVPTA